MIPGAQVTGELHPHSWTLGNPESSRLTQDGLNCNNMKTVKKKTFDGFLLQSPKLWIPFTSVVSSFVIQLIISWQPTCCDIHIYKFTVLSLQKYTFVYWEVLHVGAGQEGCLTKKHRKNCECCPLSLFIEDSL